MKVSYRFLLIIFLSGIGFSACNSTGESKELPELEESFEAIGEVYEGDFVYTPEAAVLVGKSFIYGIEINDKAKELGEKAEKIKNNEHDIVPVTLRGVVNNKPEDSDGWDKILTITDIIEISDTPVSTEIQLK